VKTVLFLINGFGIEHNNSYKVYSQELVPNVDKLKKEYLSANFKSSANNYQEGYRNISLDVNEKYTYSLVEENSKNDGLLQNQTFLEIKNKLEERKSILQLFCFMDNTPKIVDNLKETLKTINPLKDKKVFLHIVLTSDNIDDYGKISDILSRMVLELNGYAQIGLVLGQDAIDNNRQPFDLVFFIKTMISEVGEKWQMFRNKLDMCYGVKIEPKAIKPFIVNQGFGLTKNDVLLFFNYDNIDYSNFINAIKKNDFGKGENNVLLYSLFPLVSKENIPYFFNYQVANQSLANMTSLLNFKTLVLANKNQISLINYYLNGLQSVSNPKINYIEFDNYLYKPNEILNIINNYDHELIIVNYDISDVVSVSELKEKLHNIDIIVGHVYEDSKLNNYDVIISSLYGINKVLTNENNDMVNVIYDAVPFIYISNTYKKKEYIIKNGNINDVIKICYKNINNNYQDSSLIVKKSFFEKFFSK